MQDANVESVPPGRNLFGAVAILNKDYQLDDTIVAIASPPGGGVRGIVRLSGAGTTSCLAPLFRADEADLDFASQHANVGEQGNDTTRARSKAHRQRARAISGQLQLSAEFPLLPGTLYYWPTERSFTRQPAAEFHTFGSPPLLDAIVKALCASGARLARPGEFTLRAFLAGRLDLTQAEAVLSVIEADDTKELRVALDLAAGGIGDQTVLLRNDLIELLAQLEAGLDFVDEDIEFISAESIMSRLSAARLMVSQALEQIQGRTQADERRRIVLVGPPNAGKSSLLNALAGHEAAIVSNRAGTTRDYLEVDLLLDGFAVRLIDTAGLTPDTESGTSSSDLVSDAAQRQTAFAVARADLVLHCQEAGGSSTLSANAPVVCVTTKADQQLGATEQHARAPDNEEGSPQPVLTSAQTGHGLDALRQRITAALREQAQPEARMLTASVRRCSGALQRTLDALEAAMQNTRPTFREELVAAEVRDALEQLGEVTGAFYTDDLLDRIFSRFCIGK